MPNTFAYIVLLSWPIVSILMFKKMKVMPATFWTLVGGYMFLPVNVEVDFPLVPPLDKNSISAIMALYGSRFIKKADITLLPKQGKERWFIIIILCLPTLTTLTNQEPFYNGAIWIPGLTLYDALSQSINVYLYWIPLILGIQVVKTKEDQISLLKMIVVAGLLYSLPILFEVRMSPQLHIWIYGFFPHDFAQQMRMGGFRAVVFMGHGLLVSMFVVVVIGASVPLWQNKIKTNKIPPGILILYFILVLFFCKTVGAYILASLILLLLLWVPTSISVKTIQIIVLSVLLYPALTIMNLFPHQEILNYVVQYDADRAQSLGFRFSQEVFLVSHAHEKLLFGWGGWGRNSLHDSITDGFWIIIFGVKGIVGFLATFGLMTLGIIRGLRAVKSTTDKQNNQFMLAHTLIVTAITIDQIPNTSLVGYSLFLIGALIGRANYLANKNVEEAI